LANGKSPGAGSETLHPAQIVVSQKYGTPILGDCGRRFFCHSRAKENPGFVIPAQAGIQRVFSLDSRLCGSDDIL